MHNTRQELELERYFSRIRASCTRKTIITFFDLVYLCVINLPIFIIFAYFDYKSGFNFNNLVLAFKAFISKRDSIGPFRLCLFSLGMFFCCYVYFVFLPSKTKSQTFFSNYLGMRAITIDDNLNGKGKLKQRQLFKANFLPILVLPLLSFIFFFLAGITNRTDGYEKLIKKGLGSEANNLEAKSYWIYGMRIFVAVVFFMQIHYLFTVSASKRALNGFTKSNKILYVNVERTLVVMSVEGRPVPNKNNLEDFTVPGGTEYIDYSVDDLEDKEESDSKKIDFSKDIDMDNDLFLEKLYAEEEKAKEEEEDVDQ